MLYRRIVEIYERIEATSKRLEMTSHLVDLFRSTPPDVLGRTVYLTQGRIYPQFKGLELGLAEKLVVRAISSATGFREEDVIEEWQKKGDLGLACESLLSSKRQMALFSEDLTIDRVYGNFQRIASATGASSQDLKIKLVADLLHDATPVEGRYIIRTILGRLRLGVGDMTIIDALSGAFASGQKEAIERVYSIHPDLGEIAIVLAEEGMDALSRFRIQVGIPVRCMLAERLPSIGEILAKMGGKAAFEYKYDGVRVQAHIGDYIDLYSRQLERITEQFPDVISYLESASPKRDTIVEGECVPINPDTGEMLPFQVVSRRRGRKYGLDRAIEEYPVILILFDCLLLEGEDMTESPYLHRRKALMDALTFTDEVQLAKAIVTSDVQEAERFFHESIERGCEGVVAKSVAEDSIYRAGARGFLWIKYKRDYRMEMSDTLDLVIVGAYWGRGKRAGTYGALLMAAYDPKEDMFETVCKLGTGFDDETLKSLPVMLSRYKIDHPHARVRSRMDADVWFEPVAVIEVSGAEITLSPVHTCALGRFREDTGLAVRFPRFTGRWRDDRTPEDATTVDEIVELYKEQVKVGS